MDDELSKKLTMDLEPEEIELHEDESYIEAGRLHISAYSGWADLLSVLLDNGYGVDIVRQMTDDGPVMIIDYMKEFTEEEE